VSRDRVRLVDVAERAGVSRATASLVLNGRHRELRIADASRERVEQAARELGYRPNLAARGLRTRTSLTIGLISDTIASEPFAGNFIRGALGVAQEHDQLLLIGETEGKAWLERDVVNGMLDRQTDGLVFASLFTRTCEIPVIATAVPIVLLNCVTADGRFPTVLPDEYGAGRTAAEALLDAGHREGIHVVGERPRHLFAARERSRGIRTALKAAGARLAGAVDCRWWPLDGHAAVRRLLARTRPAALICLNDRIALGAYQALQEAGLRVPRDVSVVSFDGSDLASWLRPQLASVALPHFEMGRRAAELLVKGDDEPRVHRVPMPLIACPSIGPPAL
jgi:LacI family transcriptional regulator